MINITKRLMPILALLLLMPFVAKPADANSPQFIELSRHELPMPPQDDVGGNENVILSAQLIDQVVIYSGDVFSYNAVVGPRTLERGFAWSQSVGWVNGKATYIPDVGGGVCRTSTALHQAVLKAGLMAIERHNHSIDLEYAKRGDDAAVWYGILDYKFKNTASNPIRITTKTDNDKLLVILEEKSPAIITINSQPANLSATPFYVDASLMVPARSISQAFEGAVSWDGENQAVVVKKDDNTIYICLESSEVVVNDQQVTEVNLAKRNGTLYLPARFIGVELGYVVEWNDSTKTLNYIDQNANAEPPLDLEEGDTAETGSEELE